MDFAVYVKRPSDDACALVLDKKKYGPTSGFGSSQAAATMSGIAALIWSAAPSLSREQLVQILKLYGSYANSPDSEVGYGVVDAEAAVKHAIAVEANANKAPGARVKATSTFPGYDVANINDGSRNTTVGPTYSWANASGTSASSQVIDFVWDRPGVFRASGFIYVRGLRAKKLCALRALPGIRNVVPDVVDNNTRTRVVSTFSRQKFDALRIETLKGPDNQSSYVRINEVEIY